MQINPADIIVDTFMPSGSSSWIRSNNVGVRVTHVPTGIYAESSEQRSQHANRALAFERLLTKLRAETDCAKQMELFYG